MNTGGYGENQNDSVAKLVPTPLVLHDYDKLISSRRVKHKDMGYHL